MAVGFLVSLIQKQVKHGNQEAQNNHNQKRPTAFIENMRQHDTPENRCFLFAQECKGRGRQ